MTIKEESNFLKHFINIGAGTIINVLLGFITTPLITRIVDPVEYGQFNIFNTYASIILGFVYFGLDQALTRFFYDYEDVNKKKSLVKFCIFIPVISSVVILLLFVLLIKIGLINVKFSFFIITLLCVDVLITIWNQISTIVLKMTYKSKEYSICLVAQKVIYFVIVIGFAIAIKKQYLLMLVLATIFSLIISAVLSTLYAKDYWDFKDVEYPNNYKEIIKYALPFVVFSLTETVSDSLDKLLIDSMCSEYEVGIYSAALSLMAIFAMVQTSFYTVWGPMQTEHYVNNPDDTTFIQKGNKYITIIMFFLGINVIMFKDVLCYLLGSKYRAAAIYVPFVMIDPIMYTLSYTTYSGIEKSKKSYLNIITSLAACITNVVGNIILLPKIGPMGAAITRAVSCTVFFIVRTYYSNKYYYIDYDLKKLYSIIIVTYVFSFINVFVNSTLVSIIAYLMSMAIFAVLYIKDIKEMINYFKLSLFNNK